MINSVQQASGAAPANALPQRATVAQPLAAAAAAAAAEPAVVQPQSPPVHAVREMERVLQSLSPELANSRLSISKDEKTGTFVYRSVNKNTGEVIRQWPDEEMLRLKTYLKEFEGLLVDARV